MILANQQTVIQKGGARESKVIPLKITEPFVSISILIPIYNHNAYDLIKTLHQYHLDERIDVEIICCEDGSSMYLDKNKRIEDIPNCIYYKSKKNKGRSQTINYMAQKASKDYLLILDCDVLPKNVSFFQRYLNSIQEGNEVIFGGWEYMPTITKDQNLRWLFGIYREAFTLEQRLKDPYATTFTSNILIKKSIFNYIQFESSLTQYGYEDYLFIRNLKQKGIKIHHISNEIYHLNEDYSVDYLDKTKRAMKNLVYLHKSDFMDIKESRLGNVYAKLRLLKVSFLMDIFHSMFKNSMEKNLTSKKPSLFIFDIYKTSYFCYQMNKSNKLNKG
ncbi:glycosyl transferase [Neptunitalea chrysea]|uniref:Glycosyl transferase n=1 Tax=Neptunitalea chrysea TaxID=1647581 RepID=A0A9W6B736_9FLAO|nr:glycosyltransferase [Neptunitalea chrysea]GLB53741.1 glycosyl transferase [Neptunitalea chrysea]